MFENISSGVWVVSLNISFDGLEVQIGSDRQDLLTLDGSEHGEAWC